MTIEIELEVKESMVKLVLLFHAYMHGMYVDCLDFELLSHLDS